jgi:tetratricopeptide (TPR) repeat protein
VNFTNVQIDLFNSLYAQAWKLVVGEINLDGRELPRPGWLIRMRLEKAKELFQKAIAINPASWNSMFAIGKIEQRFGRQREAFDWFLKAREVEPRNPSLAKEASISASRLGLHQMAARIADEAIERGAGDASLRINSGLAHILAGNCDIAAERFAEAVRLEPTQLNKKLQAYAVQVLVGMVERPKTEADILKVVR